MTNARTVSLSLDHLVAEMIAFPFVSKASLVNPLESLHPRLDKRTGTLWRSAERYFVARFPHVGLDELVSVRNRTWFGLQQNNIPIQDYLTHCAGSWLERRGALAVPTLPEGSSKLDNRDAAARRAWRWLTFAMPGGLLLAGLAQNGNGPVRCEIITPFVARILREKGYAETHLHLGAGLDFPTAWASAVNVVARSDDGSPGPTMNFKAFASPGAEHGEGAELASWLVRAAIARYILGAYLKWQNRFRDFDTFIADDFWKNNRQLDQHRRLLGLAIRDLARGEFSNFDGSQNPSQEQTFAALQLSYNALTRASVQPLPEKLDDAQKLDPLETFYRCESFDAPTVQLRFLWHGLDYLRNNDDPAFARLFWQVERVRCQVYRHCIQRPLTPGLMNFVRVYDRKRSIIGPLEKVEFESCGVLGGVKKGLRSLEVRTQPSGRKNDQLGAMKRWHDQLSNLQQQGVDSPMGWNDIECGVVLHFLKFRGKPSDRGEPLADDIENNADPNLRENILRFRWHEFRVSSQRRADALVQAITQDPSLLRMLRGIDVCRDEHGVPTWVVAPLFRYVRREIENSLAAEYGDHEVERPPLHTTAHVGEDFVHLATGIRYMDEAIEYFPLRVGDRVGHGLALGIDPMDWAKRQHCQLMPLEDRWFDLIWERKWHGQLDADFQSNRKTYVEDEIVRLSQEIFKDNFNWTPTLAMRFWEVLYSDRIQRIGFPNNPLLAAVPDDRTLELEVERYLTSSEVYRRCRKVIWVDVSNDGEAVAELQRCVRKRYAETGITIEVNPISNLLVGDLTDLNSHPLWRLAPGLGKEHGEPLRMCIGSDDPLPFSTTLAEEYQFLYDALLLAGRSHASALAWLDRIREMGLESRFTVAN